MDPRFARAQRRLIAALVFFVVLAIFPFTPDPATEIKVLGYELFAFAAAALWLFSPRQDGKRARRSSPLFPLVLAFLCINLAAALFSINAGYSLFREVIKLAALSVLFLAAADAFRTPKQVWGLVSVICVAVSVSSVYGLVQFMGMDPFPWDDARGMLSDAPSTFGNPNLASHALAPAIILACGLSTRRRGRWALVCIVLFLCHFALTRTRGSLVALAAALLLVAAALVVSRKIKNPSRAIAVTFGILVVAAMAGAAAVTTITRMNTGQPYPDSKSLTLRYHSFHGACRLIQDKPGLGHGPGMFRVASPEYWTSLEKEGFRDSNQMSARVHNEPLEIAVEAGLPAAFLYLAILILGLTHGLFLAFASDDSGRRRLGMTLAAFYLAFLVDGLFGFNMHVPISAVLLFLVLGATAGLWGERENSTVHTSAGLTWRSLSWRLAALVCMGIIPLLGTTDFLSKLCQKSGSAATYDKAYAPAAQWFHKAESLAPYDWLPPWRLGVTAMTTHRDDEAVKHFARALELNPNLLNARIRIVGAMVNVAGRSAETTEPTLLSEAASHAQRAVQLNTLLPDAHDLSGRVSFLRAERLGKSRQDEGPRTSEDAWWEAERHFVKAIERGSERKDEVYRFIAAARTARSDELGAQKALIHSLEDKPDEMETWQLLLQSSQRTGRYDTIRTSLDWCIERLNRSGDAPDVLGMLHLLQAQILLDGYGDEAGAEQAFLHVVEKHPAWVNAWATFHAFAKSTGREEAFNVGLVQAIARQREKNQELPPVLQAVFQGFRQEAKGIVAGVSALVHALEQHQVAGKNTEATAHLFSWAADVLTGEAQRISLSTDEMGETLLGLGRVYGACQDFKTSIRLFDQAMPNLTDTQLTVCLLQKGEALAEMGKTAEAIKVFEQAVANAPNDYDARLALAQALSRGRTADQGSPEVPGAVHQ